MNFKRTLLALALAVGTSTAFAAKLDNLNGFLDWKLAGFTTETNPFPYNGIGEAETTWGVGLISQMKTTGTANIKWNSGDDGDYLYYVIYGIADGLITAAGPNFNIYNIGANGGQIHVDVYRMSTELDSTTITPSDRTGFGTVAGLTDVPGASLYLSLVGVPGIVPFDDPTTVGFDESTTIAKQTVNSDTTPALGSGSFYAEITGGSGMAQWNTNSQLNGADFYGQFDLTATQGCTKGDDCFEQAVEDPFKSRSVPEPTSISLLGMALAGMGLALRRRKQA